MSSSSILRFVRLLTLFVLTWATLGVSADSSRAERVKQSLDNYSTLADDESRDYPSERVSRSTDPSSTLNLSVDERAYLRSLPPLTLGVDSSWAPFTYLDSNGEPSGIAIAYATYLSKALDIGFDRRVYP
jgi:two-component system sensor histidine kinase EvgS